MHIDQHVQAYGCTDKALYFNRCQTSQSKEILVEQMDESERTRYDPVFVKI